MVLSMAFPLVASRVLVSVDPTRIRAFALCDHAIHVRLKRGGDGADYGSNELLSA